MEQKHFWTTERTRLIAYAVMLMLGIAAAVAFYVYDAYQRASSELLVERDGQVAYLSAVRLKDELSKYADVLGAVTRSPNIVRDDQRGRQQALTDSRFRLAVFDGGVVLLDNFGRVIATEPQRSEILGADWSDRSFFQGLLGGGEVFYSDAVNDGPEQAQTVVISTPIYGPDARFAGALAGMFRLGETRASSFYASIVRLRLQNTGNTYVLDSGARILYDSGYQETGAVFDPRRLPGLQLNGEGHSVRTQDEDGNEVVAAYAPVPGTSWKLVVEDDWNTLTAPTRRYGGILLGLIVSGMVVPTIGIILLARQRTVEIRLHEHEEHQAQAAELIQRALLPRHVPVLPGWNLNIHYQVSHSYGGDFYDFVFLPDGRLMLLMGEIADRGIQAAVEMATARATLRSVARRMLPPCEALLESNAVLCPEVRPEVGVCCWYGILDPSNGRLEYANASRLTPYFYNSGQVAELGRPGTPLGTQLDARYEQYACTIAPGERLILYSDGVLDTRQAQGEAFGAERFKAALERPAAHVQEVVEAVLGALREFAGAKWVPEDDITVIVLERTGRGR